MVAHAVGVAWWHLRKKDCSFGAQFERSHGDSIKRTKVIMLDKDFAQIKICKPEFFEVQAWKIELCQANYAK